MDTRNVIRNRRTGDRHPSNLCVQQAAQAVVQLRASHTITGIHTTACSPQHRCRQVICPV